MPSADPIEPKWFRGSIHSHSNVSDGDAPPDKIAEVYQDLGYHFVILTEHHQRTPAELIPVYDNGDFLMFAGEEVTAEVGGVPVHLNSYGHKLPIAPAACGSIQETLQANIDRILAAGGIPQVNHPNFHYAFNHRQLHNVHGYNLLEIYNGHAEVPNEGDGAHPSHEFIWEYLLTYGRRVFGVAVDDAHNYLGPQRRHPPGRGWINIRAAELSVRSILDALKSGAFYSSTGPMLAEVGCDGRTMRVRIADHRPGTLCLYLGAGGRLLYYSDEAESEYELPEDESFVRARVDHADGRSAWTQPLWANGLAG